jgi:hypothetical protein
VPAIDTTVGGSASNSYVSLLEADAYFESVYGKTLWAPADQTTREQLLVSATAALDQYMQWQGQRYVLDQALAWPRIGAYDRDNLSYPYTAVPQLIKVATFELAYYLLANGGLNYDPNKVDEVKVGSIGVKFANYVAETGLPKFIESMLSHVGQPQYADGSTIKMVRLVRT